MSATSVLRVWIYFESNGLGTRCLPLQYTDDTSVEDIVDAIAKKHGVASVFVALWKPKKFLPHNNQSQIEELLRKHKFDVAGFCESLDENPFDNIVDVLKPRTSATSTRPARSSAATALVAVVLKPVMPSSPSAASEDEGDDRLSDLKKQYRHIRGDTPRQSPSQTAQPKNYYIHQNGPQAILDGRYGDEPKPVAPPVEIYHPVFASFVAQANNESLELPEDIVRATQKLMVSSSQIKTDEHDRQRSTRRLFTNLLSLGVGQCVTFSTSSADHSVTTARDENPLGVAALTVIEEKGEIGMSGDSSIQGGCSYLEFWRDQEAIMDATFCPSFIVGIAGPWIVIMGAIITSHVVVQRLSDFIWLGPARVIDNKRILRLARIFQSLRLAVRRLKAYYEGPLSSPTAEINRFFPMATSYTDSKGERINFCYQAPLKMGDPSCITFLAAVEGTEPKMIVVKFVEDYGYAAHKLLEAKGLAPKLLYYGPVWLDGPETDGCGDRRMVVMEHLEGVTIADKYHRRKVPTPLKVAIRTAIGHLHDQNMVHGDVRAPNILIVEGEGEEESRVKVLDFDWAGEAGKVRYPFNLSPDIKWPPGVVDFAVIELAHDEAMIDKL